MKYIVFEQPIGRKIPIIFPEMLIHADVANALMSLTELAQARIVSAGMCQMTDVVVYDRSETLNVQSKQEDAPMIELWDQFRGFSPTV